MSNQKNENLTDQDLVAAVLNGDRCAFGLIIKKTEGLVAQMTFKMISSPGDRKDIAQDVYLKAFKNLRGFKFQSKLTTWIGQIAYNTCLHYLEKKKLVLLDNFGDDSELPRASLKLSINDLLYTNINQGAIGNLYQTKASFHTLTDSRAALLTFSMRFGKSVKGQRKHNQTGAVEENDRVKN